jgi:hypothetical protein
MGARSLDGSAWRLEAYLPRVQASPILYFHEIGERSKTRRLVKNIDTQNSAPHRPTSERKNIHTSPTWRR